MYSLAAAAATATAAAATAKEAGCGVILLKAKTYKWQRKKAGKTKPG